MNNKPITFIVIFMSVAIFMLNGCRSEQPSIPPDNSIEPTSTTEFPENQMVQKHRLKNILAQNYKYKQTEMTLVIQNQKIR